MENRTEINAVDEYIAQFAPEIRERLQALRAVIREAVPDAAEKISWRMPTFTLNGNLVHFAAHKGHIGLYPGPEGIEAFRDRLSEYKSSKGAVQFPNDKPLPLGLVREIAVFRAEQNRKQ
jgi:uncharacterized protein YdhG (YjbR/CyaY superfamily)